MSQARKGTASKAVGEMQPHHTAPHHKMDASNLTVPITAGIGIISLTVWLTWLVLTERGRIDDNLDDLKRSFENLKQSVSTVNDNIKELTQRTYFRTADRWTRTDMKLWCSEFRIQNNETLKCPDPYNIQRNLEPLEDSGNGGSRGPK